MKDETAFTLPDGHVDRAGERHRSGRMRPAQARDEARALSDFRVALRPESFLPVVLARVVTQLGAIRSPDVGVLERLSASDLETLERLYRELNGY